MTPIDGYPHARPTLSETAKVVRDADKYLGKAPHDLTATEQAVLDHTIDQRALSRDLPSEIEASQTFGAALADGVARFGGSWPFIGIFAVTLLIWVGVNLVLALSATAFDPYPFIFLNLLLSMLAAMQAPIIMMSQNRQAARDRITAAHDDEINLKAEIEIMELHDKLDQMRNTELRALIDKQQQHIDLIGKMLGELKRSQ